MLAITRQMAAAGAVPRAGKIGGARPDEKHAGIRDGHRERELREAIDSVLCLVKNDAKLRASYSRIQSKYPKANGLVHAALMKTWARLALR